MADVTVNYLAVLVAAIAAMVVGFIWYSPPVFGRTWMHGVGKTEEQIKQEGGSGKAMFWSFIASLLTAYVLTHVLQMIGSTTVSGGLKGAFWLWLGFVLTVLGTNMLYEKRSFNFFLGSVLYHLVSLGAMAAILVSWT